jgi:uncharacterized lipoprotein YajG
MKRRILALVTAVLLLGSCAMPSTTVRTGATRPSLAVAGAPSGSFLYVDGQTAGSAAAYNGHPNVLLVEPGTHDVEIRDGSGRVVYQQRVFVESEMKTIEVH